MTLEEQLKEQGDMILKSIEEKRANQIVYKMMQIYEDLYGELRCPNAKQENNYIHIYWKYITYMERN